MIRGLWTIYGTAAGLSAEDSYRTFMTPPSAQPGESLALSPQAAPIRSRAAAWRAAGRAARQMAAALALAIVGPSRRGDVAAIRCH